MNNGEVKSPSAALRYILSHCGARVKSAPHSCGFARLASGAFYFAVQILNFYESISFFRPFLCGLILLSISGCAWLLPGAEEPPYQGGVISQDTTWRGLVDVDRDVLVLPGATLTIAPGSIVPLDCRLLRSRDVVHG